MTKQPRRDDPHTTPPPATPRVPDIDRTGLASLELRNFRNIEQARLHFEPGLNLITGLNASGKTSVLEAIHYLGRVRSFRTHLADQPIRYEQPGFRLVGQVLTPAGQSVTVGIERSRGHYTVHLGGQPVRRLSDVAGNFPVQVFSSDTTSVLDGGPRHRRHTLDWALFHVEQRYRDNWQRYTRALRQRNAALRMQATRREVIIWDAELLETALAIDQFRRIYLEQLVPYVEKEMARLLPGADLQIQYLRGWPANQALAETLTEGLTRDLAHGFTQSGPHRADFRLLLDEHPVAAHCSRGQQKAILLGLMLAQVCYQQTVAGSAGAFLLDDLTSELDADHQVRVLAALRDLGAQVFLTAISSDTLDMSVWPPGRVFHVEHGRLQEVV